ncbi:unnamed protein product [Cuscuta epithymum]|uniref:Uncharacterized protein n=1 Tax=Cuscuta epithymum TaxID=186058 RepID=A0AAV0DB40_9ASTE|nr:unnamed protein product [Cuscuta epithymum]
MINICAEVSHVKAALHCKIEENKRFRYSIGVLIVVVVAMGIFMYVGVQR